MAKAMAVCKDCDAAEAVLTKELSQVVHFDYLHLVAFQNAAQVVSWELLHVSGRTLDVSDRQGFLRDAPTDEVHGAQKAFVVADWRQESRFPSHREFLAHLGVVSTCSLPLARGERRLGVLSLGSMHPDAYPEEEVRFLALVADQIALVLDAALNFDSSERLQDRLKLILDLTNQVVSNLEFSDMLHAVSTTVRRVMACDAAAVMLPDAESQHLRVHALDYPDSKGIFTEAALVPLRGPCPASLSGRASPLS
jgi:formate hydrogenlyase transcriptional activator